LSSKALGNCGRKGFPRNGWSVFGIFTTKANISDANFLLCSGFPRGLLAWDEEYPLPPIDLLRNRSRARSKGAIC
jgi:hypothetical protein